MFKELFSSIPKVLLSLFTSFIKVVTDFGHYFEKITGSVSRTIQIISTKTINDDALDSEALYLTFATAILLLGTILFIISLLVMIFERLQYETSVPTIILSVVEYVIGALGYFCILIGGNGPDYFFGLIVSLFIFMPFITMMTSRGSVILPIILTIVLTVGFFFAGGALGFKKVLLYATTTLSPFIFLFMTSAFAWKFNDEPFCPAGISFGVGLGALFFFYFLPVTAVNYTWSLIVCWILLGIFVAAVIVMLILRVTSETYIVTRVE